MQLFCTALGFRHRLLLFNNNNTGFDSTGKYAIHTGLPVCSTGPENAAGVIKIKKNPEFICLEANTDQNNIIIHVIKSASNNDRALTPRGVLLQACWNFQLWCSVKCYTKELHFYLGNDNKEENEKSNENDGLPVGNRKWVQEGFEIWYVSVTMWGFFFFCKFVAIFLHLCTKPLKYICIHECFVRIK